MSRPRILIVEDEGVVAIDIEEALLSFNYDVAGIAPSAAEALELVVERKPDLVLMDIHLGEGPDGIEAAETIKQAHGIPVVFLTAYADRITVDRAKQIDPYGYVLKPFRYPELRTAIELALFRANIGGRGNALAVNESSESEQIEVPNFAEQIQCAHTPTKAMQVTALEHLRSLEPFTKLGDEYLESMAAVCPIENFKNNSVLLTEGAESGRGFLVLSGRVGIFKSSPGGKELTVELVGPLDMFGVMAALEQTPFPFSARAQGNTRILWIPREIISHISENHPEISCELFRHVFDRLRKSYNLARALAHDRADVRIASTLLALMDEFAERDPGGEIAECQITRHQVSELTGTTPETVSRVLTRLQSEGVVDLSQSGKVRLLDREGVELLVAEQNISPVG